MNRSIITLITDFGTADSYVAQIKGCILGINPDVQLVDVTHAIPPQDVRRAADVLDETIDAFPDETIHVVVVDPGVGTNRRIVGVELAGHRFIAPDNGVLSGVCRRGKPQRVVCLTSQQFWRQPVSHTFHGRDIMAPVAAHWSRGGNLAQFGEPTDQVLAAIPTPQPLLRAGVLSGEILWCDRFGNLITNIDESLIRRDLHSQLVVEIGPHRIDGIHRCYGDKRSGMLMALFGSSGRLEIAVNQGSAARKLQLPRGTPVRVVGLENTDDD